MKSKNEIVDGKVVIFNLPGTKGNCARQNVATRKNRGRDRR